MQSYLERSFYKVLKAGSHLRSHQLAAEVEGGCGGGREPQAAVQQLSLIHIFPELREAAPVYLPFEYGKHEKGLLRPDGSPGFYTATGRIELCLLYTSRCV